jgi:hypothetical protein
MFDGMMSAGDFRIKLTRQSLKIADSLASEQGTYTLEMLPKPPADTSKVLMTDHGSYVTTFINRNGEWRALYDVTASALPAPPAPAPAKPSTK